MKNGARVATVEWLGFRQKRRAEWVGFRQFAAHNQSHSKPGRTTDKLADIVVSKIFKPSQHRLNCIFPEFRFVLQQSNNTSTIDPAAAQGRRSF